MVLVVLVTRNNNDHITLLSVSVPITHQYLHLTKISTTFLQTHFSVVRPKLTTRPAAGSTGTLDNFQV